MAKADVDEAYEDAKVGTLTVKLPSFWPDKPEAWFGQAEANFRGPKDNEQEVPIQPCHCCTGFRDDQRRPGSDREAAKRIVVRGVKVEVDPGLQNINRGQNSKGHGTPASRRRDAK